MKSEFISVDRTSIIRKTEIAGVDLVQNNQDFPPRVRVIRINGTSSEYTYTDATEALFIFDKICKQLGVTK